MYLWETGGTILIHEVVFSAALTPECFYKSYKDRMSEGHDQCDPLDQDSEIGCRLQ